MAQQKFMSALIPPNKSIPKVQFIKKLIRHIIILIMLQRFVKRLKSGGLSVFHVGSTVQKEPETRSQGENYNY